MADGNYLFRESDDRYWRAATIEQGMLRAPWKLRPSPAENYSGGQWHGPLADDDPDWQEANADPSGRLFRELNA